MEAPPLELPKGPSVGQRKGQQKGRKEVIAHHWRRFSPCSLPDITLAWSITQQMPGEGAPMSHQTNEAENGFFERIQSSV